MVIKGLGVEGNSGETSARIVMLMVGYCGSDETLIQLSLKYNIVSLVWKMYQVDGGRCWQLYTNNLKCLLSYQVIMRDTLEMTQFMHSMGDINLMVSDTVYEGTPE